MPNNTLMCPLTVAFTFQLQSGYSACSCMSSGGNAHGSTTTSHLLMQSHCGMWQMQLDCSSCSCVSSGGHSKKSTCSWPDNPLLALSWNRVFLALEVALCLQYLLLHAQWWRCNWTNNPPFTPVVVAVCYYSCIYGDGHMARPTTPRSRPHLQLHCCSCKLQPGYKHLQLCVQ